MIITRTLGQTILGKPTLTQIGLTCVLASIWGFLPGMEVAPLSVAIMVALLLVLKANLPLAVLMAGLARILALLIMPLTFKTGVSLIEGPMGNLFVTLINGSGTALMGFDYYITAGSWTLGVVWGALTAFVLTNRIRALRTMVENLEEGSETYQKLTEKGWMRFLGWLVFGVDLTKVKPNFEKKGGPIRIAGVALVVLMGVGIYFATPVLERYFAKQLKNGLERGNGATVDVEAMTLSFSDSRLTINGLEMADPEALELNRFQADKVEVDLSVRDLLARRIVLDRVEASGAAMGMKRDTPGEQIGGEKKEWKAPEVEVPDYETLESYWKQAKELREKLREARSFLEEMTGSEDAKSQDAESFEEWLAREVANKGYEWVRAVHKIEGVPAFMVRNFKAHDVKHASLKDEMLNMDARNLSTHPELAEGPAEFSIRSSKNTFDLDMSMDEAHKQGALSQLNFAYRGFPMDDITAQLKESAEFLKGGTVDFGLKGGFRVREGSHIELPLEAVMNNVTLQLPKVNPVTLNDFPVVVMIKGPLDNPKLKFDHKAFMDTLRKKGLDAVIDSYKQQLKDEVDARVEEETDKLKEKAKEKLGEELGDAVGDQLGDELGGAIGGLLGSEKKDDKDEKATDSKDEKKDKPDVGSLLGGLLDQKAKEKKEKEEAKKKEEDQKKDETSSNN